VTSSAASRSLLVLSGVAALVAVVVLGRLTVFMADDARPTFSAFPSSNWELQHSCVSAYFVAADAARDGRSVYRDELYTAPNDDGRGIRKPRMLGRFGVDVYEYPPPFLLLPTLLRQVVPGFSAFRLLWFVINGIVVAFVMVRVARALPPPAARRALLLAPLVWVSLPTLSALQKGNVQLMIIALAMLAMLLFERRRFAAGGALLAFATVSKLFPGLLLVYLIVRRQWRAVAWTAAMSSLLVGLSLVVVGARQYAAFADHLPGLVGGEAFPAFRNPGAVAINLSIPGLVFKLKLLGLGGLSFGASKIVGWLYTLVLLIVVVTVSRRPAADDDKPALWLGILILATLRSPFLPQAYASFPALWLLTLLAARQPPTAKTLLLSVAAWLALNVYWPMDWPLDPRVLALVTLVPQAVTVILAVLALRPRTARTSGGSREHAGGGDEGDVRIRGRERSERELQHGDGDGFAAAVRRRCAPPLQLEPRG
jgi:alpha-1,2-mannosyltransferase